MPTSLITEIRRNLSKSRQTTLELIGKVDPDMATRRPRPNAWSVKDHVAHMVAVEESIIHFSHRILDEDCPISPFCYDVAFNQDAWNNREVLDRAGYRWTEAVCALEQTRIELLNLLEHIPEDALIRIGSHPVWGTPVTLTSILRHAFRHERGHQDEIAALCSLLANNH